MCLFLLLRIDYLEFFLKGVILLDLVRLVVKNCIFGAGRRIGKKNESNAQWTGWVEFYLLDAVCAYYGELADVYKCFVVV